MRQAAGVAGNCLSAEIDRLYQNVCAEELSATHAASQQCRNGTSMSLPVASIALAPPSISGQHPQQFSYLASNALISQDVSLLAESYRKSVNAFSEYLTRIERKFEILNSQIQHLKRQGKRYQDLLTAKHSNCCRRKTWCENDEVMPLNRINSSNALLDENATATPPSTMLPPVQSTLRPPRQAATTKKALQEATKETSSLFTRLRSFERRLDRAQQPQHPQPPQEATAQHQAQDLSMLHYTESLKDAMRANILEPSPPSSQPSMQPLNHHRLLLPRFGFHDIPLPALGIKHRDPDDDEEENDSTSSADQQKHRYDNNINRPASGQENRQRSAAVSEKDLLPLSWQPRTVSEHQTRAEAQTRARTTEPPSLIKRLLREAQQINSVPQNLSNRFIRQPPASRFTSPSAASRSSTSNAGGQRLTARSLDSPGLKRFLSPMTIAAVEKCKEALREHRKDASRAVSDLSRAFSSDDDDDDDDEDISVAAQKRNSMTTPAVIGDTTFDQRISMLQQFLVHSKKLDR